MENTHIKERNRKLAAKVLSELEKRHFQGYFCEDRIQVPETIKKLLPKEHVISWGGSTTLQECGIFDYLEENGYKTIDRALAKDRAEQLEISRQALLCDTFLMSSNAITEDGQLVNIDGLGNRLAALLYGPKSVIVIAGMNKVVKTLDDAIQRARTIAAPVNMQRIALLMDRKTPCVSTGSCADCKSPDSICSQLVITRLCAPQGRIKVILVNEDLGF